jgi:hypothetical protein
MHQLLNSALGNGAEPRDILVDLDGEGYDGGGQTMV